MAKTVLSEKELVGLIQKILSRGHSREIRDWMDWIPNTRQEDYAATYECLKFKDLGFMDFNLGIPIFVDDPETNSVMEAGIQVWRKSKWFSEKHCRKVFHLFINSVRAHRYAEALEKNPDLLKVEVGYFNFANETKISLEMESSGCADSRYTDVRNDFITLKFIRIYD